MTVLIRKSDTVTLNPSAYIGLPLLGRRLTLSLRREDISGVCVAVHRRNGVIFLAPAGARREDGTWSTLPGARTPYVREEILRITVEDRDQKAK